MKKWSFALICGLFAVSIFSSCNNSGVSGYTTSGNGLQYKLIKTGGTPKATEGQYLKYASTLRTTKGEFIFSSKQGGSDLFAFVNKPRHKGDPLELLTMMGPGDSASVVIPENEFFNGAPLPANVKKGDNVVMDIIVYNVYTADQYTNEVMPTLQQAAGMAQKKKIEDFIASKGWKADRTASGLYIVIDNPGNGTPTENGKMISMNYDGTLLDGSKFDSNVDPAFNHVQPFDFTLGQGQVIKGWDEGILKFKKGGKGKLIIPAELGYGDQGQAKIPAGSVLVFEVEVLDVKNAPQQQPMQIQAN